MAFGERDHGEKELKRVGFKPMYAPAGIDTNQFKPIPGGRKAFHDDLGMDEDNFIIGTVGLNYADDRKGFIPLMIAFKEFRKTHPEASLFIYRPFCQFICPFGLYSWLLENISIKRIKIIEDKCIKCEKCVKTCPTQAMKGIYEKKRKHFLPDCWSCGACIEACPTDAIKYSG